MPDGADSRPDDATIRTRLRISEDAEWRMFRSSVGCPAVSNGTVDRQISEDRLAGQGQVPRQKSLESAPQRRLDVIADSHTADLRLRTLQVAFENSTARAEAEMLRLRSQEHAPAPVAATA